MNIPPDQKSQFTTGDRSPALILLLTLVTCGLYLIYWYYQVYEEMQQLHGLSPTGNDFFVDLLIVIITCGIWGIYVDFAISEKLNIIQKKYNLPHNDTTTTAILLDLAGFIVGLTNIITSMIHQDQLNTIRAAMTRANTQQPNYTESQSPRADLPFKPADISEQGKNPPAGEDSNPYN